MQKIYTKLSRSEVTSALAEVAKKACKGFDLAKRVHELGDSESDALKLPVRQLVSFLAFVANHVEGIETEDIAKTNLGLKLKWLTRHPLEVISKHALDLHVALRSKHRSAQAAKRARLALEP